MSISSPHAPGSELWCEGISGELERLVDADSVLEYAEVNPNRWHLGASEIGNPCSRAIWYSFRWSLNRVHTGRMQRLFKRGHWEEPKFVHRLKRIGVTVWDTDTSKPPNDKGEYPQFQRIHPSEPHYGGSLDGIAYLPFLPVGFQYMIAEFKTHGDNSFTKLVKNGVRKSKPQHYAQMSTYGKGYGYQLGLYCAINKNDDDLKFRITPLDHGLADMTDEKAIRIIRSPTPPRRYSENSGHQTCKYCDFRGICHLGQPKAVNCRSCRHASPNPHDREWTCALYGPNIPRELVLTGCPSYVPVE